MGASNATVRRGQRLRLKLDVRQQDNNVEADAFWAIVTRPSRDSNRAKSSTFTTSASRAQRNWKRINCGEVSGRALTP